MVISRGAEHRAARLQEFLGIRCAGGQESRQEQQHCRGRTAGLGCTRCSEHPKPALENSETQKEFMELLRIILSYCLLPGEITFAFGKQTSLIRLFQRLRY